MALALAAFAATLVGDREAGARMRPLLEPLRPFVLGGAPSVFFGQLPELVIGRLELLAGHPDAAVAELTYAVEQADAMAMALNAIWARIDLARALHRRGSPGDQDDAASTLADADELAARHGIRGLLGEAAGARAELEGRPSAPPTPEVIHTRPVRALTSRTGRRAMAALIKGHDDETLERRFAVPRRQRAVLKGMARGFQPDHARGFTGVIAYEIEPYVIAPPPDSPWRWALEVDGDSARLIEPAPLDAAVTIHLGLADWIRALAGTQNPVTAMAAGRGMVEGDVLVAARLEAMFGAS